MITEHLVNHTEVKSTANPFPGLRAFEYHENDLFFGREGQSEEMVLKLEKTHFLAVVGTSGSGKSSLVRAGLWPALRGDLMESAGSAWRLVVMRPGNSPIFNLAIALNYPVDLRSPGAEQACVPTVKTVQTEVTLRRGSPGLIEAVRQAQLGPQESLLIVVDQFEELFRFGRISEDEAYANDAAAFVKLLLEAKQRPRIYIVLTMRSDYLGECARFLDLPEAINDGQYLIPRMTRPQRRGAITGPVGVRGASLSPQLVDKLLIDTGDSPQQLPILQHALMRIWENWRAKGDATAPLDISHYEECGGLAETMSRHANEAYDELPDDRSRWIAEKLFKSLTEKGADAKETRRPTKLGEICHIADASAAEVVKVIDVFRGEGRCFLMPSDRVSLTADITIDISHESLIGNWDKLKKWVEDEAYSARLYREFAEREGNAHDVEPLRGSRLDQALDWRKQTTPNVAWASRHHASFYRPHESTPEARRARDEAIFQRVMALIETSEKARDRKAAAKEQAHQKKLKQARRSIAILIGVSAIILVLAAITVTMKIRAEEQSRVAKDMRNRAEEQSKMVEILNYRTVMNLAYNEYGSDKFGEANQLLLDSLPRNGQEDLRGFEWYYLWHELHNEQATLHGISGKVLCVAISPDSKTIATGSEDHLVKLWDANTGQLIRNLEGHNDAIISIAFSSDGKRLVTGSFDRRVISRDFVTGKIEEYRFPRPVKSTTEVKKRLAVRSMAFSPNGLQAAIGWNEGSVMIWDAKSLILRKHKRAVGAVAFSPDGARLVSGSDDGTVRLWDVKTGQEAKELQGQEKELQRSSKTKEPEHVLSVAFSRDGKTIAAGTDKGRVRFWHTKSGKKKGNLARRIDAPDELIESYDRPSDIVDSDDSYTGPAILSLTYRDNDTLIIGNADATLRLWKIKAKAALVFKGHSKEVSSVAVSPDGQTVVTGSADTMAKLWDISRPPQTTRLNTPGLKVSSIAFFPENHNLLVGGCADGSIVVWDTEARRELHRLTGDTKEVKSIAVTTDGKIASWSEDGILRLWDPNTNELLLRKFISTEGQVISVAFSPDGQLLATGSDKGTVTLWVTSTGAESKTLSPKPSEPIWLVAFASDGRRLATVIDGHRIELWDTRTGERLAPSRPWDEPSTEIVNIAFSPDHKVLASGSNDNTAKLWDVETGELRKQLNGRTNAVQFVFFSRDGRLATLDSGANLKFWDTNKTSSEGMYLQELASFRNDKENKIQSLVFSPDGMMMAIRREFDVELGLKATWEEVETQLKESR